MRMARVQNPLPSLAAWVCSEQNASSFYKPGVAPWCCTGSSEMRIKPHVLLFQRARFHTPLGVNPE